ncbi:hypothetical protein GBA52_014292 [Prunus armeniaca]|nr:hypothetical protein GBA52_014292 [Prunus armeniaca]
MNRGLSDSSLWMLGVKVVDVVLNQLSISLEIAQELRRRSMSGAIGAGGVLRNSEGLWIEGFTVNLGLGQFQDAEIWGLFFGLKLAISHNSSPRIVEMDSTLAVSLNANK